MSLVASRAARRAILGALVGVVASCDMGNVPPAASFLVVAGDSTYWVERFEDRLRMRGSPLLLARVNGDFSELYIADDDRSFRDALIVGQRIYKRDLVTGDSVLLREDSTITGITRAWLSANPTDVPLKPDEDTSEEPATIATTETQLLDVVGPFVSFEYHLDVDVDGRKDQHLTRRGVIDLRTGREVRLEDLAGSTAAARIYGQSETALAAALDSVRNSTGERAERAQGTLDGFRFDSASFELMESDRGVEVAFLVPGRGVAAAGYALPLPPVPLPRSSWMEGLEATRPQVSSDRVMEWADSSYSVVVRSDSDAYRALLSVSRRERSWPVGLVPIPVRRVHRVDSPGDSLAREVLARAFDDAAGYSAESRTASWGGKAEKRSVNAASSVRSCSKRPQARSILIENCGRTAGKLQQTLNGKPNKNGTRNPPRI